uniref:Microbe binding protein n=1 Tax=Manduca sexta TaxID=7130 RepID=A0A3G1VCG4_MANSE|nr:microbe binding protein [Manduca sexta]
MAAWWCGRVITLFLCVHLTVGQIPNVSIHAYKPKGFSVSIPDGQNIGLFAFHGNINRGINKNDVGTIAGEVLKAKNGMWIYEDPELELKVGDVIHYYVFVSINSKGYLKDNLSFTVTKLEDRSSVTGPIRPGTVLPEDCKPTRTKVRGGFACAGQTLFEDNFDMLDESVWQIEQYIPNTHPEYPFVSYQHLATDQTVTTAGGTLRITPKLQQDLPGFTNETILSGTLNLFSGCTSSADSCLIQVDGADILPPVASGRITSKTFAFTYGKVYVRAKLPQGDWLYPEILLEPFLHKYGSLHYSSGVIKIATARGNRQLYYGPNDYSNKVLYGGPIMDLACRETLLSTKLRRDGSAWGDDFHLYSLEWTPEHIVLMVDDEEWARVEPTASGLRGQFPASCRQLPQMLLRAGTSMAPFDDYFYLTLGVAAGSITEFPDGSVTVGDRIKPWRNSARKAMLNFWQDTNSWLPTWLLSRLEVDYVKVVAL